MKKQLSNEEIEILDLLSKGKYTYNVMYIGFDHKEERDLWIIEFGNENWNKTRNIRLEYFTGVGHRFIKTSNYKYPKPCYQVSTAHFTKSDNQLINSYFKKNNTIRKPDIYVMQPEIAGVLYCYISDSEAMHESFNDWCDNFGYDKDSISAFNIYQDCCKHGKELYSFFPKETIEKLKAILEDY